jgi:hypothetical protein
MFVPHVLSSQLTIPLSWRRMASWRSEMAWLRSYSTEHGVRGGVGLAARHRLVAATLLSHLLLSHTVFKTNSMTCLKMYICSCPKYCCRLGAIRRH